MAIAFFDFDGTICKRDSFLDFIYFTVGKVKYYKGLLLLSPKIFAYIFKLKKNDRLKEDFFSYYFSAMEASTIEKLGKEYSKKRISLIIYSSAIDRIRWHKQRGDQVYIISASSSIWLGEWCKEIGVELIGTKFIKQGNRYTGKIDGQNCYGKEKQKIIEEILSFSNNPESYGYGDSTGDKYFLKIVTHRFYKFFS